jgi:hypothetical protein
MTPFVALCSSFRAAGAAPANKCIMSAAGPQVLRMSFPSFDADAPLR